MKARAMRDAGNREGWLSTFGLGALAILILVLVWQSLTIPLGPFLPTPAETMSDLAKDLASAETFVHVMHTSRRILIAFVGSMVLALGLALLMGRNSLAESFFKPWIIVAVVIPGPMYVIFGMLILGVGEQSTLTALTVSVTPFVTTILFQGVRSVDKKLVEMSHVYGVRKREILRQVILPHMLPAILAGARTGFGLSWKLVVVLEALSANEGIGERILYYFRILQTSQVLAWTILFTVIMYVVETTLFGPLERHVFRWRKKARARIGTSAT